MLVNELEKQLHITKHTDWYRVSLKQIQPHIRRSVILKLGGIKGLLSKVYVALEGKQLSYFF